MYLSIYLILPGTEIGIYFQRGKDKSTGVTYILIVLLILHSFVYILPNFNYF
jgi:hypothetical protein